MQDRRAAVSEGVSGDPMARAVPVQQQSAGNKLVGARGWFQRLGVLGFAFFFVKGLLWLIVPALIGYFGCG
jgi:hypothetical protein